MSAFLKQKLTSRKFWVAVASAAFIILSEGLGLNVDSDLYWKVVTLALGYIFGETAVDIARAKADATTTKATTDTQTAQQ
ncbi:hypothetical protein V6B95_08605 [Thermoanaerobacterium saccharolyticum]|uniref:hypothetical protein n=1 Tax=Thermoanaerobacterium saccharolyticum TaxID=28896 RepID=UPI002FD911FB